MNKELKNICRLGIVVLGIALAVRINIFFVSEVDRIVPLLVQSAALMLFGAFLLSIFSNAANAGDAGDESENFIPIIFFFSIGVFAIVPIVGLDIFTWNYPSIAVASLVVLGGVVLAMFRWVNKQ